MLGNIEPALNNVLLQKEEGTRSVKPTPSSLKHRTAPVTMHVTDASKGYRKYDNSTLGASQHLEFSAAQVCKVSFKCSTGNPYRELDGVIKVFFFF